MYYFDYAATTPVCGAVAEAMVQALTQRFGNPSSQYPLGREARDAVAAQRAVIAAALDCDPADLFFTLPLAQHGWQLQAATDFVGSAHPQITEAVYTR